MCMYRYWVVVWMGCNVVLEVIPEYVCVRKLADGSRCTCIQVNGYVNEFCGVGLNGRYVDV